MEVEKFLQKDLANYLISQDIDDLSKNNIFFGWKQNTKARIKQIRNKYNVAIINKSINYLTTGKDEVIIENEKKHIKTTYDTIIDFDIRVFNYYNCVLDGVEKDYYDCEKDFIAISSCFINQAGVIKCETNNTPLTNFNTSNDLSFFEYILHLSIRSDIIVKRKVNCNIITDILIDKIQTL